VRRLDIKTAPVLDEQRARVGLAAIGGDNSFFVGDSSLENSFICTKMFDVSPLRDADCSFVSARSSWTSREVDDEGADDID